MITNNQTKLRNKLKNKGIMFERGDLKKFEKYSYYQTINAYKPLFVESVQSIDQIYSNIKTNTNIDYYKNIIELVIFRMVMIYLIRFAIEY